MPIPTYDDWMTTTKLGTLKPRSSELKGIDEALKAYTQKPGAETQKHLRFAIGKWIRSKGDTWKQSERNKPPRFIVEELRTNAFSGFPVPMTKKEIEALKYMEDERRIAVQSLFRGRKLTLKAVDAAKSAASAFSDLKTAASNIRQVGQPVQAASSSGSVAVPDAVKSMFSGMFDGETASALIPTQVAVFGQEIVSSVVPIVSHFASGAKVVLEWGKLAKAKHKQYKTGTHAGAVANGDARAAFRSLDQLLQREVTAQARLAGIQTADFGSRSLLALADGGTISGPLVGVATALAKLAHTLFLVGREYSESKAANTALANPSNLDFRLFEAMPLCGCYMLYSASLNQILNMATIQFGNNGWMDDVDSAKLDHIDPIRQRAKELIDKSIYQIKGMQFFKKP